MLGGQAARIDTPELKSARVLPSLEEMVAATARHFGVDETAVLASKRGRGIVSPVRSVVIYVCQKVGEMKLGEIADAFGLASCASAGSTIRHIKGRILKDKTLAKQINHILPGLTP